ncbi:hypothetical protein ACFL1V_03460 [Pseudomonadota bacterium]
MNFRFTHAVLILILSACDAGLGLQANGESTEVGQKGPEFEKITFLNNPDLDEVSGIQSGSGGVFFVHLDSGGPSIHVIDHQGRHQGEVVIREGKNRDWEDMTAVPQENGRLLVMGDIGDNETKHKTIRLYFVHEPLREEDGPYPAEVDLLHRLKAYYPDRPRDAEAMAYDPSSGMILLLTKRDRVPRIYGISVDTALSQAKADLEFLGEVPTFRPPTATDLLTAGKRGVWISQPTGMDISADGTRAAVITYRSLYLWSREDGETWAEAFQNKPFEIEGPPGLHDEAVAFSHDGNTVFVTTERLPTPLYRLSWPEDL